MGNLKIILELLSLLKGIYEKVEKYFKIKKREKEITNQRGFENEVEKKVENGAQDDIDDLNKFFKS
jgi:hypothetical protein